MVRFRMIPITPCIPESNSYNLKSIRHETYEACFQGNDLIIRQVWWNTLEKEPPKDRPFIAKLSDDFEFRITVLKWHDGWDNLAYYEGNKEYKYEIDQIEKWTE